MNKTELQIVMLQRGDTVNDVSKALGISATSFYNKKNERGTEFTQGEIKKLVERWELTPDQTNSIFFA